MPSGRSPSPGSFWLLVTALFFGGVLLLMGNADDGSGPAPLAQLVSLETFSDELCVLPDASSTVGRYSSGSGQAAAAGGQTAPPIHVVNRAPSRFIKDPWPAWSAIAVNPEHDMVVMTDENLHRIVEYHRLDNTPPRAEMTEPRRVIAGTNTASEMLCGVHIDPETLDIYVTNNDTVNYMPVFSREARGNAVPDRVLATPHRTWGIAADDLRKELFITLEDPAAVMVYRKMASGAEAPIRLLEGDATELADPHGIAIDVKNDLMVVTNHGHRQFYGGPAVSGLTGTWEEWIKGTGIEEHLVLRILPRRTRRDLGGRFELPSINIYARDASGNAAPLRVIKGPRTRLNWPSHVAVHEDRGEIFVANDADDSVLVFRASDRGDVAPTRVVKGPRTRIKNPTGVAVDAKNNELWVASMGNYGATVYPIAADGNVQPLRTIRGGPDGKDALMIGNPGAVAYDTKRQQLLVPN
jgi:DNA-binding beta-propeller fold protein YncE